MKDCQPCQGIRRLTPRNLAQRAGLRRIDYRVGDYAAFFESMLAALSAGQAPASVGQPAGVLAGLRTREQDDPSIALLDAWAVIADVLTFYQEQIANEAFLNTATQPASMHELARLLGYTPRPGLSSSVWLSFTVDDRADEVAIPSNTKAQSTPVPGSGTRPQVFETSGKFQARAEWNVIYPRRSQPQSLQKTDSQNLDRLYLRGTGLRVQPNSVLAIGNADLQDGYIKQVARSEERNKSPLGPVTVLHFVPAPLSADQLVRDIQRKSIGFFNDPAVSSFFVDSRFQTLRDQVFDKMEALRQKAKVAGLIAVDEDATQLFLDEVIDPTGSGVRQSVQAVIDKFTAMTTQQDVNDPTSDYAAGIDEFIARHQARTAQVTSWLNGLTTSGTSSSGKLARELQTVAFSAPLESDDAVKPKAYVGVGPSVLVADAQLVMPHLDILGSTLPTDHEFEIDIVQSSGIALHPPGAGRKFADVVTALKELKRNAGVDFPERQYVGFRIRHNDGTDNQFIAAGVQPLYTMPGTEQNQFPSLQPQVIQFVSVGPSAIKIDPTFDLGAAGSPKRYQVVAELWEGDGDLLTSSLDPPDFTGTPSEINDFVRDLEYTPSTPSSASRATVLITIMDPPGTIRAIALRTLAIDEGPLAIRNGVNGVICGQTTLANLKSRFGLLRDALSSFGATKTLKGVLTDSDAIGEEQARIDLELLGTGGATASLGQKIADLRTAIISDVTTLSTVAAQPQLNSAATAIPTPNFPLDSAADVATSISNYGAIDIGLSKWSQELRRVNGLAQAFRQRLFNLGGEILQALLARRVVFLDRSQEPKDRYRSKFEGFPNPSPEKSALDVLDQLFSSPGSGVQSLRWRLDTLQALIHPRNTISDLTTSATITSAQATIQLMKVAIDTAKHVIDPLASRVSEGRLILNRWDEVISSVSRPAKTSVPPNAPVTSAQALGSVLLSGGDVTGLAVALNRLDSSSSLWVQLLGALAPAQRQVFYSSLRRFRNITSAGLAANSPFAFRSRANLFGWNAPNVVKTTSTVDGSGKVTTTEITSDPRPLKTDDVNITEPLKEWADHLFADGRLEKSAPGSPIAINIPGAPDPDLHWVRKVTISPRTAYEVSADTTRLDLTNPNGWWEPTTDVASFEILRGTKVWCDAEELTLSEKLIADDAANVMIPGAIDDQGLQLDDVYPDLMAGMKVVISGVPYQEEEASNSSPPQRDDGQAQVVYEVATISGVKHGYDNSLYGDAFRTTIAIEQPLSRRYWRDTVEIQANVVEATHGETVHEPLGSGEARRAFQKFELSSTPLTRLSKGDLDGQEPALEVRVNKVRWDRADRLYDREPQSESYELLMTREGQARVQFGDGVQGARLPTGEGNIRATYRKGLGLAGNVDIGRIDQLPAPPLGVKSVINPVGGDGGADPDSVWQSKLRIPLSPIRAGKLISRRDYESFALLFAGVEKARADVVGGGVELTVAGPSPGPLRLDGKLMQSLSQAIELYGDPQVPCQVAPHAGKLLYVEAQLEIDERADWSDVKQRVREALLQRFGYREAQLGQEVLASDVVATIQQVPHVLLVEVQSFFGITSEQAGAEQPVNAADQLESRVCVAPHELCYIAGVVDNTILLEPRT